MEIGMFIPIGSQARVPRMMDEVVTPVAETTA